MITGQRVFNGVVEEQSLAEGLPCINDDNYYDDRTYITNSMLGKLKESPVVLRDYLAGGGGISTSSLSMGDAVHKGILEPDKFETMVKIWSKQDWPEPDKTLRTKSNKEWLDKFKEDNKGMCILEDVEWFQVQGMIESIKKRPEAQEYLKDAVYEQIALAFINGIPVKSKGDIVKIDKDWIIDIKTTSNVHIESFKSSCEKYGYYRQAAMYRQMFGSKRFGFLVVENTAPFNVAFYEVSEEKLEEGWKEVIHLIEEYKHYFINDPMQMLIDEAIIKGVL
jgi:hypothetical protein